MVKPWNGRSSEFILIIVTQPIVEGITCFQSGGFYFYVFLRLSLDHIQDSGKSKRCNIDITGNPEQYQLVTTNTVTEYILKCITFTRPEQKENTTRR